MSVNRKLCSSQKREKRERNKIQGLKMLNVKMKHLKQMKESLNFLVDKLQS